MSPPVKLVEHRQVKQVVSQLFALLMRMKKSNERKVT